MTTKYEVGDLVKLYDDRDPDRNIGIVVSVSEKKAHIVAHGSANIIQVYWPKIQDTDWEYDFFLRKFNETQLTKDKK